MLNFPIKRYPQLHPVESLHQFKDVDSMLRQEGIEYCITGGTLLGCIRHQGFIPWDDDIDLVVPIDCFPLIEEYAVELGYKINKYPITTSGRFEYFISLRKEDTIIDFWPSRLSDDTIISKLDLQNSIETAIGHFGVGLFLPYRFLKFEDFYAPVPQEPFWLLDYFFYDWRTTIVKSYSGDSMHDGKSVITESYPLKLPPLDERFKQHSIKS